jgi:ethanolamine utilization protein EutQ (cupin superfamily)
MSSPVSNVVISDTFSVWLDRTNELASLMSDEVLTADTSATGAVTTGNAFLSGIFGTTTMAIGSGGIRGGNVDTSDILQVTSNLNLLSTSLYISNTETINSTAAWIVDLLVDGNATVDVSGTASNKFSITGAGTGWFTANATVTNAYSLRVSTNFIANTTVVRANGTLGVNATSFSTLGNQFIANTLGIYTTGVVSLEDDQELQLGTNNDATLTFDSTSNAAILDLVTAGGLDIRENGNTTNRFEFTPTGNLNVLVAVNTATINATSVLATTINASASFNIGSNFTANTTYLATTGNVSILDDKSVEFGTGDDATLAYVSADNDLVLNLVTADQVLNIKDNGVSRFTFQANTGDFTATADVAGVNILGTDIIATANTSGAILRTTSGSLIANSTIVSTTANLTFLDNKHIVLGTGLDSTVYFEGTNTVINMVTADQNLLFKNAGTTQFTFEANTGNFTAEGDVSAFSDIRLKDNVRPIENALSVVTGLEGVSYELKRHESSRRHIGLIAQDVEQVVPEVISETDGYKTIAYGNMVALLVEAIKELKVELDEIKSKPRCSCND